ncbi:hypothetical protein QBC47DRAFT_414702 [Echria macrotheca]|uniref:DUF8021 domain-containing protein n=1 Tax=Echria macrotheca TaxID=438768 RepID=A0AAJ0FAZ0_9PEZI|nr:hypothetical protein QBC47DRAFT_414702 [Echria macrotheca]
MIGLLLLTLAALASATCDRASLKSATDRYIIAQSTGQLSWLAPALSPNTTYWENLVQVPLPLQNNTTSAAILSRSLRIDHHRTAFDTVQCATFTELLSLSPSSPYQIATQLRLDPSTTKIQKIDSIVTTTGDLLFSPSHALHYILQQPDWNAFLTTTASRTPRASLQAAADAYYDFFVNKSVVVPWDRPCTRVDGGFLDTPDMDCNTDIPDGVTVRTVDRRYVIDEDAGVVQVTSNFGVIGPDSHEFWVVGGKIRGIRSATVCPDKKNCGLERPAALGEDIGY